MTLNEYQQFAARTMNYGLSPAEQMNHALHGLCSEVGEIHGLYQKQYQGKPIETEHLKKELGDTLWMVAEYCTARGWELDEIAKLNINKLRKRYPDGFDPARSMHREEGDV